MEHFVTRSCGHIEDIFRKLKLCAYRLVPRLYHHSCTFQYTYLHDFTNFLSVSPAFVCHHIPMLRINRKHSEKIIPLLVISTQCLCNIVIILWWLIRWIEIVDCCWHYVKWSFFPFMYDNSKEKIVCNSETS